MRRNDDLCSLLRMRTSDFPTMIQSYTVPPTQPGGVLLPFPTAPKFDQLLAAPRAQPVAPNPIRPTWLMVLVGTLAGFAAGILFTLIMLVS